MSNEPRATLRHVRELGWCASGARAWCARNGVVWDVFLHHGLALSWLDEQDDAFAQALAHHVRAEAVGGQ